MAPVIPAGFRTDRLDIRHWRAALADPDARAALQAELRDVLTPEVLRSLPEPLQLGSGPGAVSRWMDARAAESDVLTVRDRGDERLLGLLILARLPEACHVGYLFAERAWGRGLATELLRGLIAARGSAPDTLVAGVGTDNPVSARVLRKAGFTRDDARSTPLTEVFTCAAAPV